MDAGKNKEFDHPFKLLVNDDSDTEITSNSLFAQMILATGPESASSLFKIAQAKYFED